MKPENYLDLPYNFVIKKISDQSGVYFHGTVLELDGCQSTGDTVSEVYECLKEAMLGWIETKLEGDYPVPLPYSSYTVTADKA